MRTYSTAFTAVGTTTCYVERANDMEKFFFEFRIVRLAKKYDGDDTGSFVNGILGAFARNLVAPKVEETE